MLIDIPANSSRLRRFGCLGAALGSVVLFVTVPFRGMSWDGSFPSVRFHLTVVEPAGRPVPGVAMHVQTRAGGPSYFYPVNEYLPGHAPTSDADGRMVVHHVGRDPGFGGRVHFNQLGYEFGETDAPQYVCVFRLGGREVGRVRYTDLRAPDGPQADRPWLTGPVPNADWPRKELFAHSGDWDAHVRRLFDGNGDGKLDREERVARHFFEWYAEGIGPDEAQFHALELRVTVTP
jgi:hypothetical protein